ncbi:MAG: Mut7-C RNAse domain-containing protein [Chloroflexi bacterium]|nr:Mut7-C RNAse domain-containing protein [Chloroflexota bacterium]
MKFVADAMLGRLAKWLRILGYDTLYSAEMDDASLARLARQEGRILLTRDTRLVQRRGLTYLLVESDIVEEQLRQVVGELRLDVEEAVFSRCPSCNTPLETTDKPSVAGLVPPYVYATQGQFKRCPRCRRLFWRGTHWDRMKEKLAGLRESVQR